MKLLVYLHSLIQARSTKYVYRVLEQRGQRKEKQMFSEYCVTLFLRRHEQTSPHLRFRYKCYSSKEKVSC